jgi:hypothetical protein
VQCIILRFTRHSTATSGPPSKARSRAGISEEDEEEEFDEIDEQEAVAVLQEAGEDVAAAQVSYKESLLPILFTAVLES